MSNDTILITDHDDEKQEEISSNSSLIIGHNPVGLNDQIPQITDNEKKYMAHAVDKVMRSFNDYEAALKDRLQQRKKTLNNTRVIVTNPVLDHLLMYALPAALFGGGVYTLYKIYCWITGTKAIIPSVDLTAADDLV